LVEFEKVSKIYPGGIEALKDVSFKAEPGEFVFLSGPSGAGKSTLLRLLYREESPSSGRVLVDGKDVGRLSSGQVPALRRSMGIIFQDFKLLYQRTVFENVAFALQVLGLPTSEVRRETEAALALVGLSNKAGLNPHKLSGGEQQKVAVARALAHDPSLVLADEPTGNLDAETGWEIFGLLDQAHRKGATVLVATHNRAAMDRLGKRVVQLRNGSLETPQEAPQEAQPLG
jgi:cell division transport system ATP-binding protein